MKEGGGGRGEEEERRIGVGREEEEVGRVGSLVGCKELSLSRNVISSNVHHVNSIKQKSKLHVKAEMN
jgi:hypothetical protein